MSSRWVPIVGFVGWPLLAMLIVFFVTRRILRSSARSRILWAAVFLLSVLVCVGDNGENYLSMHHVPLYWNLYATCYLPNSSNQSMKPTSPWQYKFSLFASST